MRFAGALDGLRKWGLAATGLLLSLGASPVLAEGSRTLYPATYPAGRARAPMDLANSTTYAGVARNRQFLYVYAEANEYILVGSRNVSNAGDVFIYNPQSFGARGNETIPGVANFTSCSVAPSTMTPMPTVSSMRAKPSAITTTY